MSSDLSFQVEQHPLRAFVSASKVTIVPQTTATQARAELTCTCEGIHQGTSLTALRPSDPNHHIVAALPSETEGVRSAQFGEIPPQRCHT